MTGSLKISYFKSLMLWAKGLWERKDIDIEGKDHVYQPEAIQVLLYLEEVLLTNILQSAINSVLKDNLPHTLQCSTLYHRPLLTLIEMKKI